MRNWHKHVQLMATSQLWKQARLSQENDQKENCSVMFYLLISKYQQISVKEVQKFRSSFKRVHAQTYISGASLRQPLGRYVVESASKFNVRDKVFDVDYDSRLDRYDRFGTCKV